MANSTPNNIFRFVSTRAANTPEKDAQSRRFIFNDQSSNDAQLTQIVKDAANNKRPVTPILFADLPLIASQDEKESLMMRTVKDFVENSHNRIDSGVLEKNYPFQQLRRVYLWHRDNNQDRQITPAAFQAELEKQLGDKVQNFVGDKDFYRKKLVLWENLIAEYIMSNPGNGEFMSGLVDMIRWFWILEKLTGANNFQDGQEIYEAMYATVVLSDNLIYVDTKIKDSDEPKTREPNEKSKIDDEKYRKSLENAGSEIQRAYKNQATDEKYDGANDKNRDVNKDYKVVPMVLSPKSVKELSGATQEILNKLGLLSERGLILDQAMDRLKNEMAATSYSSKISERDPFIDINGRQFELDNPCHNYTPPDPCSPYNKNGYPLPHHAGLIRKPGFADLKVIRSVLLKYEIGELAHVENVLDGETKTREFNTLKRMEETLTTEEESTTENEKETQTTDRFELEKEMSSITKEDMKIDTGVKVTATLGPVNLDTHFDFQYNTSKEDSNKTATKTAQETVNRALSRVIERKKSQKTVTTILQTEDNNKHELKNQSGNNIHGLYYWIDKLYLAKVVNYGKRLMFEFIVPEPAAFYLYTKTTKGEGEKSPPVDPVKKNIKSYSDINDWNYAQLAAVYNAQDIIPPPPDYKIVTTSLKQDKAPSGKDEEDADKKDTEFTIVDTNERLKMPDGYIAHHADVSFVINQTTSEEVTGQNCDNGFLGSGFFVNCKDVKTQFQSFHILIGNKHLRPAGTDSPILGVALNTEDSVIPVSIKGMSRHFIANIEVVCYRTDRHYKEWQNQTFNAIMTGYRNQLQQYEDWKRSNEINEGVHIEGNNPDINRKIEKEELKKHCIEMMSGQRFESFDAMRSNVPSLGYPEFSITEAYSEGTYIQFFEQAFEWEQITYVFYPYFWGRKPFWINTKKITDPDPIFSSFLQAGAARVLVPARPGFDYDVITFFASGGKKIWGGKQAPIPGSKHWLPIIDEIKEQEGQFKGGAQEGAPWIYKVPTTLVYLDNVNAGLQDNSANYPVDLAAAIAAKTSADFS